MGNRYRNNSQTNALKFDGTMGSTLIAYSAKEIGVEGGSDILESIGLSGTKFVSILNLDEGIGGLGDTKYNNIVLYRHGGMDGSGDDRMIRDFAPDSRTSAALSSRLVGGGNLWLNECFGGCFVVTNPQYLPSIANVYGAGHVYYGTGVQAVFETGIASRVANGNGTFVGNSFLNYQVYTPRPQ